MTQAELIAAIDALPIADRLRIADHVYEVTESSDPAVEAAWADESERRWAAYQRGEMGATSAAEVFRKLGL